MLFECERELEAANGRLARQAQDIHAAKEAFERIRGIVGAGERDAMPAEHYVALRMNERQAWKRIAEGLHEALKEMAEAFDSDTARRLFTKDCAEGWTMLEIGACDSARRALTDFARLLQILEQNNQAEP
jgi:excinuclease UvrABC helicase subunit UvrB